MPVDLLPGKEQRMLRVVNVRRFAGGAVEFDDGKMLSGFEVFPAFETDIKPTKMEAWYPCAYLVDHPGE